MSWRSYEKITWERGHKYWRVRIYHKIVLGGKVLKQNYWKVRLWESVQVKEVAYGEGLHDWLENGPPTMRQMLL